MSGYDDEYDRRGNRGSERGSGRSTRDREGGDRGGGRRRGGDDWYEEEAKDGGRRRGGDRGDDRRERSPRRARDASRSEERAPEKARGGGRRKAEKADSRSASEEAPVSRGKVSKEGKARKEDVDDDDQVEKKAKKAKDQGEKKADDSKEAKAAPAKAEKAESSEAEKKDSGKKDPPLTVGDCKDKTISAIIKGTYTPHASNHNRTVYKKDEKSKGIDVFIYYWDDRDGEDLCGWWFSPHVGGDEVWAYHPSRNHTTPPPSDWNVPHDGDIDPQFRVTARKAGDKTEDRKEKSDGKEEPKAKDRTDKAKDAKEKVPEKTSERAQEDPYGEPSEPADRKSRKPDAKAKEDEPDSPKARRSSRDEAKAARKESPPARRRTRDASEEPAKDEAPPARKERAARKESPPARSRTPPKDSKKESSKSEHLIKMDFKEKDSKADEKAAESGSSKPSFASRYEQRLQKQQEEREKKREEEREEKTKRREKPKEAEAAPPKKRDVSVEKEKEEEKKKEESAEEEEAPKPAAKAAAPEPDSSPEPEKQPEKAPPAQEKEKSPEPEEPKEKEKEPEKQPEAAPRRKRRSKDDSEDSEEKSEQEDAKDAKPLKRRGGDAEEKKPQEDEPREERRQDDRRGGRGGRDDRDDDRRGGRDDDRDDDDRRGARRGGRDDDRRGGRDDDRRGGRGDDRRGGGGRRDEMDDGRGGGRDGGRDGGRGGGRNDDDRGNKRGGRRDDDRSPAAGGRGGPPEDKGRDDDRRGGQDRRRGEDDRRGGRDERPQRGDRDRDEPQRDEPRRGDRERTPPPREERKPEPAREEPKVSAEDRQKQREEEDKKREEREEERKKKEKEDEERKKVDDKKRDEDRKDNEAKKGEKEEMRKAKEVEMKRKDEELQKKRAAKRQEEDEKRKALEEERREANAEKRKIELAQRSEAEKKRDAERKATEEAAKKQKDDEAMAVKQQQATLSVLQVLQKLSSATPENFEELKKELDEVLKTELPLCGAQEEILRAEAQRVVEYAQQYVGQVLEQRAADTKQKTEAEEKIKKSESTARDLLAQLEKLVVAAEEASENVHSTAAPLLQEITVDDDEVMRIAATVHKQGKAAMAACSFCADFITTKRPVIQEAESMQNESTQAIAALLPRIKGATRRTAEAFQKGKEHRTSVCKRTSAKRVDKKNEAVFKKYATSDDGLLSIKDLAAYAKAEFDFELPEENMKRIVSQLFPFGQSGLSVESFKTLKTAVGIARTEVRGKNRKEEKAKRQEHVEERKTVLGKQISDLMLTLDGDESNVRQAETEAETLASQAGSLQADDLKERADAVEAITTGIKTKIADFRQTGLTIFNEVHGNSDLELQLRAQLSSLDTRLRGYEERLQKATEMAASGRQLALYMAVSEYEGLWTEVVVKLRSLIETDGKTIEELFSTVAGVSKDDESVQSVSTEAIYAYIKKHDTATEQDKVDKLFLRNVAAEEPSKKEGEDEKPAEEGKKEDGDAKMEEKADEKEKDDKEGDKKAVAEVVDSEEEDDYISASDLEKMTVPALKALCKAQDVALAGKKDELVKRLSEKYEAAAKDKQIKKDAAAAVKKMKDEAEAADKTKKDEAEAKVAKMKEDAKETGSTSKSTFKGKKEVSKEEFNRIVRMYYKVARQCVLSDNLLIEKSAQIRRMEVGEILEVFKGPAIDTSVGVYRLLAKAVKDGTVGWATIAGNQGITFLMPGGRIFTVKAAVALTVDRMDLDGTSSGLVRTLKEGEFLEVMEWAKTSQSALGVLRIQARAQSDGAVGWATVIGNDGTVLLEAM